MPPRWLCVLIITSWLLLTGWLFYSDLLPRLLPGQPPPVTIDLVEEAQTRRVATNWTVHQDGRVVCVARTRTEHPRRDLFELVAEFPLAHEVYAALAAAAVGGRSDNFLTSLVAARCALAPPPVEGGDRPPGHLSVGALNVLGLSSVYRVNADGDLLGFEARLAAAPQALDEVARTGLGVSGTFDVTTIGEVRDGRLTLTREWGARQGKAAREEAYSRLAVARGAAVVLPLHPPKRMRGVSPGQSWRAVVVDPFASALGGEPVVVRAQVRPTAEPFRWGRRQDVACLVIDYEGERVKLSTWVSHEDGMVLAQEATLDRTRWAMYRHPTAADAALQRAGRFAVYLRSST
jgi:hypothetical protein